MNRKVLFITYFFPPSGAAGVFRPLKFTKYLPTFGFKPIVITVNPEHYNLKDDSLLREIPNEVEIIRTKLSKKIIASDFGMRWIPSLIKIGDKIINREKPDIIFISGSPFYSFIVGPYFFHKYKIPYIIDFRDPWYIGSWFKKEASKNLKYRLNEFFSHITEKVIIRNSAAATFVSQKITDNYKRFYHQYRGKFHTITNGFDPEDFSWSKSLDTNTSHGLTISHIGTIDHFKNLTNFAKAMKKLIESNRKARHQLFFIQIGEVRDNGLDIFKKLEINIHVKNVGYMPHIEALKLLMQSDILLLHNVIHEVCPTSKIFEYIYSCKPILNISFRKGIDRKILSNYPWKACVEDDVNAIYDGLTKLIDLALDLKGVDYSKKTKEIRKAYEKYSRISLTEKLVKLFNEIKRVKV